MHVQINIHTRPKDVLAQEASGIGLLDGVFKCPHGRRKFAATVDVGRFSFDSKRRQRHSLDQLVRIQVYNLMIVERARLALITIAQQVAGVYAAGQKRPLAPSGEPGPTASAQARITNDLHNLIRLHFGQGFAVGNIPIVLKIHIKIGNIRDIQLTHNDVFSQCHRWFLLSLGTSTSGTYAN